MRDFFEDPIRFGNPSGDEPPKTISLTGDALDALLYALDYDPRLRNFSPSGFILNALDAIDAQTAPTPPSIREQIIDAADEARAIHITYRKADGRRTERQIVPSKVNPTRGLHELVVAYDLLREEPRTFRLDRIEAIEA